MTLSLLVVNWEVFTTNICCLIAKIVFQICIFRSTGYELSLGPTSRGQIYTTMQNYVKADIPCRDVAMF